MNTKLIVCFAAIISVTACSRFSSTKTVFNSASSQSLENMNVNQPQDGRSYETAVVVNAKTDAEGAAMQWEWIEKNLPGARIESTPTPAELEKKGIFKLDQILAQHDGKFYDVILLRMPDGKLRNVYFDITGYFGKKDKK